MRLANSIYAIDPDFLAQIEEIEIEFNDANATKIEEALRKATSYSNIKGNVAILPLKGYISNRTSLFGLLLGTPAESFGKWFQAALNNPEVGAIVIDVDSGGGEAQGTQELSKMIYEARGPKPIISVVNAYAASAAYHIASAADEMVITPSGLAGSIGVLSVYRDESKALEDAGVKYTIIKAGQYKAEATGVNPLSDEALAYRQSQVDEFYADFVNAVARNRGITAKQVQDNYGQGRVLTASKALEVGMVDRIGTMDQVLSQLQAKKTRANSVKAEIRKNEIEARR